MNNLNFIVALVIGGLITFSSQAATDLKVDTKKSKLEWLAKKVTGQHNGEVAIESGTLSVENDALVSGDFTINMTTISVIDIENADYNQKLKDHLNSPDFFNTGEFPEAKFSITSAKKVSTDKGNYEITGNLTIKGITNSVTFPANVEISKNKIKAVATITFDRAKFDVRYGSGSFFDNLGDKTIYDDVEMTVSLEAGL